MKNFFLSRLGQIFLASFLLIWPFLTSAQVSPSAALKKLDVQIEKTTGRLHMTYSIEYKSSKPIEFQVQLVATDETGSVININAFRDGPWKQRIPASTTLKTYSGGSSYLPSGNKKASKVDVIWNIKDTATNRDIAIDTKTFSPLQPLGSGGTTGGGTGGESGGSGSGDTAGKCFPFENTLFNPGGTICAPQYLRSFYFWAVTIALTSASVMIIYAGYKYTTSRGDQGAIKDSKDIIISVLVGVLLLLLSYTILRFLGISLGSS